MQILIGLNIRKEKNKKKSRVYGKIHSRFFAVFIVLGKWDLLSILMNNVTILVLSDNADKVTKQKAREKLCIR